MTSPEEISEIKEMPAEAAGVPAEAGAKAQTLTAAGLPAEEAAGPEAPAEEAAALPEDSSPAGASAPEDGSAPSAPAKPEKAKVIKKEKVKKLRRRKRKILERSAGNDIRYRGPLSYRHLRTLAWICIAFSQVVLLMHLDQKLEPEAAAVYETPLAILGPLSALALPLLLVANFAVILDGKEGYLRQVLRYGVLAAGVVLGFDLAYNRYFVGTLGVLIRNPEEAPQYMDMVIGHILPQGYFVFNIFIDLFLCSLFMCLLNCRPTRVFKGKWVLILRFLAIIPAAYEIASIVLKIMAGYGYLRLPAWVWPLLTTKPPLTFLVFISLAFYIKRRERLFRRHGRTHEEFIVHMQTNYNSLRFSLFTAKTFLLTALLDVIAVFGLPVFIIFFSGTDPDSYGTLTNAMIDSGFGGSITLLPMIPIMLLFSYTRTYRNRLYDAILPLAGIFIIFCIYIEGGFQALQIYGSSLPPSFGEAVKTIIIGLFS